MDNNLILQSENVVLSYDGVCFSEKGVVSGSLISHSDLNTISDAAYEVKYALTYEIGACEFSGPEQYAVIHFPDALNYWNWLTIALLRLSILQNKTDNFTLLLPEHFKYHAHITDSLEAFGIRRIKYVPYATVGEISKLMLPLIRRGWDGTCATNLRNVAHKLVSYSNKNGNSRTTEKLYVSRKGALYRKIINESDVESLLKQNGFMCTSLEEFTLYEKVRIFQTVQTLLCVECSDAANILFMNTKSRVIVLKKKLTNSDDKEVNSVRALAVALDIKYSELLCQPVDADVHVTKADIEVDLSELEKLINSEVHS